LSEIASRIEANVKILTFASIRGSGVQEFLGPGVLGSEVLGYKIGTKVGEDKKVGFFRFSNLLTFLSS